MTAFPHQLCNSLLVLLVQDINATQTKQNETLRESYCPRFFFPYRLTLEGLWLKVDNTVPLIRRISVISTIQHKFTFLKCSQKSNQVLFCSAPCLLLVIVRAVGRVVAEGGTRDVASPDPFRRECLPCEYWHLM
jgi:hypothetical protein